MNNLIYICLFLTACATQSSETPKTGPVDTTYKSEPLVPPSVAVRIKPDEENDFIDKSKFKVEKQPSFNLKNWYYGARKKNLEVMTVQEIKKYFQDSELKNDLKNDTESSYYFFSIQQTSPVTVITLIEEYDICCADLLLMRYDTNNQLMSKQKVAGIGGDGGWDYTEFGNFTSNEIYQMTRVDRETLRDDQDTMEYRIDSVILEYQVNKDFRFTIKNEQVFQRNQIVVNEK